MEKKHLYKNNCSSANFFDFNGLKSLNYEINEGSNENTGISNSSPSKKYSQSTKNNKINSLNLVKFMENQSKKRLTTNFAHKDVVNFLKEKDKAMEKIIIDEEIIKNKDISENHENKDNCNIN